MKRNFIVGIILLLTLPCQAQWKYAIASGTHVYAFGAHDTTAFFMSNAPVFDQHELWRFVPNGITGKWGASDNGIDFSQGNVTSFASIGSYMFAGMARADGANWGAYRTTDNGVIWKEAVGAPVASNGVYIYGTFGDSNYVARSLDGGNTWQQLSKAFLSLRGYALMGTSVFVLTSNSVWRSTDTGNTWSPLTPHLVGPMTTMDSLLFITAGGNVIVSTDSGQHWNPVAVDSAGTVPEHVNVLATDGKILFAGTTNGVFISTDYGQTWRAENAGLTKSTNVYAMGVFDTLLFVANNPGDSVFYRSIPEMIGDTGPASVVAQLPPGDSIDIYPNPASGMVSIRSGGTVIQGIAVLNVLGENVLVVPIHRESSFTLDLSKLPSGTYFLRIQTAKGSALRKIVINR